MRQKNNRFSFHLSKIKDQKLANLANQFRKRTLIGRKNGLQMQIQRASQIATKLASLPLEV